MKSKIATSGVPMGCYWGKGLAVLIGSTIAFYANTSVAQITPDATLPNNTKVNLEDKTFNITEGTSSGGNLFHSFKEFSVPTGSTAFFDNGADIQNIINRVTGGNISNIDGLIKANGSANLFLINPSGIVFGENARLDIGGSFIGTTADSMRFSDGTEFSAVNPQSEPLLTVNVPLGLQYGTNPGSIQVRGDGEGTREFDTESGIFDTRIIDTEDALRVNGDKTLTLIGGDINLEGATLKTAGGRIELGSVGENGLVNLVSTDNGFTLDYSGVENFRDIELSQQANVDASGEGGGDIQVQGKLVSIKDGSEVETSTLRDKQGGDLVVNATESVEIIGLESGLLASVFPGSNGDAGDLTINTEKLFVRDGAQIDAGTFGEGKGGNLNVTASETIQVIGESADGKFGSGLFASSEGSGDAGDLTINTEKLFVRDGAQIDAGTFGEGNGGNLNVTASETIEVIGESADGRFPSGLFTSSEGSGDARDLTINTEKLVVRDGAVISASTFGEGNGGNLNVTASETIQVIGRSADGESSSGLFASSEGSGDARDLTINTQKLVVRDGAVISASTFGEGNGGNLNVTASETIQVIGRSADGESSSGLFARTQGSGDAGDLTINTQKLVVRDGVQISAATLVEGNGGNLNVTASETIEIIGTSADGESGNRLSTQTQGSGDAGDLTINTQKLFVRDGAQISAGTLGEGNGGNLNVTASETIEIIGESADGESGSGLFTQTQGSGDARDLTINTEKLVVRDGAVISAGTFGEGNGGNLNVTASETIEVIGESADGEFGRGLFTQTEGSGEAGDLTINTNTLQINQGIVSVESFEEGNAGDLNINVNSLGLDNNARISANTQSVTKDANNPQANININSRDLILRRNSNITTNARGQDVIGGNIDIDTGVLAGFENSNITANSDDFRGGNVLIKTQGIFGMQFREQDSLFGSDITATGATNQLSGDVEITTPDTDSNSGLIELPSNVVDASNQISKACTPGGSQFQNEFVITGRGGLPMSAFEALQESNTLSTWVRLKPQSASRTNTTIKPRSRKANNNKVIPRKQIVEATGWIVDKNGNIEFVADASQVNSNNPSKILQQNAAACNG